MKTPRIYALALILVLPSTLGIRAEEVVFSWWDPRYATPGLISDARGGYTRDARLPDQEDIREITTDSSTRTNREPASVLVVPKGSVVVGPAPFTARSQSDFGRNHAETSTFPTGFGESENREYYDRRNHSMIAESVWADQWTFSGPGLGASSVTLTAGFDVAITDSPCTPGPCEQVSNPVFTRQGMHTWWYRLYGSIRIFDLDVIDQLLQPDSDYPIDVPRQVGAFEVFQQGSNIAADSFGALEPFPDVPNARLSPIHATGTTSFVPVSGHRYAVAGRIHIQARDGADVDAGHTLSLDQIQLGPGLRIQSVASASGAHFEVLSATRLTASRTAAGQANLAFPTAAGFTYVVEFTDELNSGGWTTLETRTGNDQVQIANDPSGSASARFYRLRVE